VTSIIEGCGSPSGLSRSPAQLTQEMDDSTIVSMLLYLYVSQPSTVGASEVTGLDDDVAWGLMVHSLHILSSQVKNGM
jgi:hypothetical protein